MFLEDIATFIAIATCINTSVKKVTIALNVTVKKCFKMNPSKVPAALDPFKSVWKHYTHPEGVPVKKFKIT